MSGFGAIGKPDVAVCLLPGNELMFEKDIHYYHHFSLRFDVGYRIARFRQLNIDHPHDEHDALEFSDGRTVPVSKLGRGPTATQTIHIGKMNDVAKIDCPMPVTPSIREFGVTEVCPRTFHDRFLRLNPRVRLSSVPPLKMRKHKIARTAQQQQSLASGIAFGEYVTKKRDVAPLFAKKFTRRLR